MANTNTDLTEEDAADLQFPKENDFPSNKMQTCLVNSSVLENSDMNLCANCYSEIINPSVLCEKCDVNICLKCFSKGVSFANHSSDHDYRILSTKFVLFENSDWTAEEELKLLDATLNYSNWNLVAQEFPNRTASEVVDHYNYFYLDGNGPEGLPLFKERSDVIFPQIVVPYRIRLGDNDEPPRYLSNTTGYKSLAGYNPARSDFENEYDKNADDLLSSLEYIKENDTQHGLLTKLQCSIIDSYNRRLRERQRWKNIISQHGLLLLRKTVSWLHRYDMTIQKPVYEKMIRFMQFCEPIKFEMLMEGMHRIGELKVHISRLMYLRRKGITTLAEGRLFLKLQQQRDKNRRALKQFRQNVQLNWKQNTDDACLEFSKFSRRRSFAPMEIWGMPSYTKLSEKERELCRTVRLAPAAYLQLRDILVSEYKKTGSVKLQTARKMLKIDVNKTRKLYDFLIEEGYIAKP